MDKNNPLINSAMQIILHAGDARNNMSDAISEAAQGNTRKADELMQTAQDNINKAHEAQTKIIQNEMAGQTYEPCILFTHAQDTLMTVMSEMKFSSELIKLHTKLLDLEKGQKKNEK